jgi:hypothetical protein
MTEDEALVESYRRLVGDLLVALAGTAPKGRVVEHLRETLCRDTDVPRSCMEVDATEAMEDFSSGTDRPARLMRLLRAAIAKSLAEASER